MQEDLRNRYFQQNQPMPYPNQAPPPPYNPVLQPYEQPKPRSSGAALAFWLFVMFGLMALAAYFGYFAPLIAKLRSKIKELTPPTPDSAPTSPAPLWYEVIEDTETEEKDTEEQATETTMMAQPTIDDKFANMMDKYGLLDKSQMNGNHVGEELLNQPPTQQGDEN